MIDLQKYRVLGIILLHVLTLGSGWLMHDAWDKNNEPVVTKSSEKFHSEVLKPGKADTSSIPVSVEIKERIKKGDNGFENGPVTPVIVNQGVLSPERIGTIGMLSRPDYSTITRNLKKKGGSISLQIKTYPGIDSADIAADYQWDRLVIKQTDTLEKKDSEKTDQNTVLIQEPKSLWKLGFGTSQCFADGRELEKYINLSYSRKIWFFYVSGSGGIFNGLGAGFKEIKIQAKVEVGITL